MGWNTGYTIFEATVIGAYDLGVLTPELLSVLMEPYRGTDIDDGGRMELVARDGKEIHQVVIETFGGVMEPEPADDAPDEEHDVHWDGVYDAFQAVTDKFGWG